MKPPKQSFFGALKPGDEIFLVLPSYYIEGKVIEFVGELKFFIKLSNVKMSGNEIDKDMTLNIDELPLLGWGKK